MKQFIYVLIFSFAICLAGVTKGLASSLDTHVDEAVFTIQDDFQVETVIIDVLMLSYDIDLATELIVYGFGIYPVPVYLDRTYLTVCEIEERCRSPGFISIKKLASKS